MSLKKQSYSDWICNDCGIKYGKPRFSAQKEIEEEIENENKNS